MQNGLFRNLNRRAQDWAIVRASIVYGEDPAGVGLVNMHSVPFRSAAVDSALLGGASAEEAAELALKDPKLQPILMHPETTGSI
jgi:hypothetical protein